MTNSLLWYRWFIEIDGLPGFTELKNGWIFYSYVKLPEGISKNLPIARTLLPSAASVRYFAAGRCIHPPVRYQTAKEKLRKSHPEMECHEPQDQFFGPKSLWKIWVSQFFPFSRAIWVWINTY